MKTVRLHKAIADAGVASRRAAEKMISQGRVTVNGKLITTMGVLVDPDADLITVDDKPLAQPRKKRSYLVYKPKGVLCTRDDPEGRSTIYDILPDEIQEGLHSAGRLDYSAEGLIILTNDGDLTQHLTHPSTHIPKTYMVKVRGKIGEAAMGRLRKGVELDDGKTLPAEISPVDQAVPDRNSWIRIVLREGRKNQIKRMGDAVGYPVLEIIRTGIGPIESGKRMKPGTFRKLSPSEVKILRNFGQ
ncbi:rRNA pseudouridine synthase [bacterium]|nr:MAG: rRNA pseudouridine synthase [bacterium]